MHPETKFTEVPGETFGHEIAIYGLTRCEPCREARQFMEQKGWGYRYVHLERQPQELRQQIKKDFAKAHGSRPIFPVLEIDGEYHFGFNPEAWERWIRTGESTNE
jgi:glutaredoxin